MTRPSPTRWLPWLAALALAGSGCGRVEPAAVGTASLADSLDRLPADRIAPSDYARLGEDLANRGSSALAWSSLEAARRLDPTSARASTGRIDDDPDVASAIDKLGAVPEARALGALAVGIERRWPSPSVGARVALDRLIGPGSPPLTSLASPAVARRRVARLLLEDGRPAEALGQLDEGPEADWLRARAYLQLGDEPRAAASLAKAGGYGLDAVHLPEPATYAGALSCKGCHSSIYKTQQSSHHASTIRAGAELAGVPLPPPGLADPVDPRASHTFTREAGGIRVAAKVDGSTYEALLDYAMGSGHRGTTLVGRDADGGGRRSMRISSYNGDASPIWDVTSGFSPHPATPRDFLGKPLSAAGFRECLHCHTTRFRDEQDRSGPEAADRGIGCERCHGPGGNHADALAAGWPYAAIGRPKLATAEQRMSICARCHAADGSTPPDNPEFARFQSTTLTYSRCYTESGGKLDCTTCHDPHKNAETSVEFYTNKCLGCHNPATATQKPCPVEPSRNCTSCHMPRVGDGVSHTPFADHHIRARRGSSR